VAFFQIYLREMDEVSTPSIVMAALFKIESVFSVYLCAKSRVAFGCLKEKDPYRQCQITKGFFFWSGSKITLQVISGPDPDKPLKVIPDPGQNKTF